MGILRMKNTQKSHKVKPAIQPSPIITLHDMQQRKDRFRDKAMIRRNLVEAEAMGYSKPRWFADYVQNGMWKGRRCFIIGGGPSVQQCDLSLLEGELTIGINRAYELLSPSILFGVDGQLWGWAETGKLGEESKAKFMAYKGYKVWIALHELFPPDFYMVEPDEAGGYRIGTTERLAFKNNAGYGAINLAAALGANPIYLLGFDMHGDGQGKQKWWHPGYPVDYGENIYARYIEEISNFAPVLHDAGIEVVNLNPQSKLTCFPFGEYQDVVVDKPAVPPEAISVMTTPGTITAITPTGDRPLAFGLCKHWMDMQTVRPDQWIVVDDGKVPMTPPPGADYIRREPKPNDPAHTLNVNILAALPHVRGSKILIIEDDEYYAPRYVEVMAKKLDTYEVVGISHAKYYHLPTGSYAQLGNMINASLAQTGFLASFLGTVRAFCENPDPVHYLDMRIWFKVLPERRGFLFNDQEKLYVGMKGLPGRLGIGVGHSPATYCQKDQNRDKDRSTLRKWVPGDSQVYLDILSGKLSEGNVDTYFPKITGISVCCNTKDLMQRAYESVRRFHPDMPIIIIDGSDETDPCFHYTQSIRSKLTTVLTPGYNIGHGRGMCLGIKHARTPYALIFDSDIEMLKSPMDQMLAMMEQDTYGVGYVEKTGFDGYEYGAHAHHKNEGWMPMLHPYFHLLNIAVYRKFHPYVHHGAPCYLAALDIYKRGLSGQIIKEFPGLGHSSGKGWTWTGQEREWIRHDVAGTRKDRVSKGLGEIEGNWVLNKGQV
ncbi:MAG: glycosyltransferase family 2 protein [Dehalococcoidales bacterium]|nr:glycosyltransferase family 2 protein [Dehalococcoidales bacterium]